MTLTGHVQNYMEKHAAEKAAGRVKGVRAVAEDFPFLGACYGIGVLGRLGGGIVDRTWGEPSSQLHERHEASDFDTQTQDKVAP